MKNWIKFNNFILPCIQIQLFYSERLKLCFQMKKRLRNEIKYFGYFSSERNYFILNDYNFTLCFGMKKRLKLNNMK